MTRRHSSGESRLPEHRIVTDPTRNTATTRARTELRPRRRLDGDKTIANPKYKARAIFGRATGLADFRSSYSAQLWQVESCHGWFFDSQRFDHRRGACVRARRLSDRRSRFRPRARRLA